MGDKIIIIVHMLKLTFTENLVEAGCDEVGRGCLAGPVVAAAVILPFDYKNHELTDSKLLNKKQRTKLQKDIRRNAITYAIAEVSNEEIDKINILNASFLAMHRAIDQLLQKPQLLLIDGNRFNPYPNIPHQCVVKGDQTFLHIAAASVLAKTYRDDLMTKLGIDFPQYGWDTNVGYPTAAHRKAIKSLGITPYHRRTFRLLEEQLTIFKD